MSSYISAELRKQVYERAGKRCEYCLLHEDYAGARHEVDHIYAEKHGGETILSNLCLSCLVCNRHKGSDIASIDPQSIKEHPHNIVSLYHPRIQKWSEHFEIIDGYIEPLTEHGRVTVRLLRLNDITRLEVRRRLYKLKRYP